MQRQNYSLAATIAGVVIVLVVVGGIVWWFGIREPKPAPPIIPAEDTTYITGPIAEDGSIDYETALNERMSKGITPENNANVALFKAFGPRPENAEISTEYYRWLGIEPPSSEGHYFLGFRKFIQDRNLNEQESQTFHDQLSPAMRRPWTAEEYPEIAAWLEVNEEPLVFVLEALKRPDYFNPLVAHQRPKRLTQVLLPTVQKCREMAAALTARAMLSLGAGNLDAAWRDLLACHRLGRLVAHGTMAIEGLVGMAIDLIAANGDQALLADPRLTAKQAGDYLRDLQGFPAPPPFADKVELAERFLFLDMVQHICQDGLQSPTTDSVQSKPDRKTQRELEAIDWAPTMRVGNHWFDRMTAALRIKDRSQRENELNKIDAELKATTSGRSDLTKILKQTKRAGGEQGMRIGEVLVATWLPYIRKIHEGWERAEQSHRSLHIAFALAIYQREHGEYPDKLEGLCPKYLTEIPTDLFSSKGLIYRPAKDGYLLYSVGLNGHDEGGRWKDDDPPGDDLCIRIPLPPEKDQ